MGGVVVQQHRGPVIGRDREVREVVEVLCATGASAPVLLVTGEAGTGKTAVLEQARRTAAQEGTRVLRLGWEGAGDTADVTLAADPVRGLVVGNLDDCPLRLSAFRRAQLRAAARDGEMTLLSALAEAMTEASRQTPYALVVDGVERMPPRVADALGLLLRMFRPRGVPVVMAGRPVTAHVGGSRLANTPHTDASRLTAAAHVGGSRLTAAAHVGGSRLTAAAHVGGSRLTAAADRVLVLPALRPADVAALVAALVTGRFGRPAEPALAHAVSRALGTLAGNPRAVLAVLDSLEAGDLTELDGQLCLTAAEGRLRLATEPAELIRFAWPDAPADPETVEAAIVTARVMEHTDIWFEDVLRMTPSTDARAIERKLDQLVADGLLTVGQDGRLSYAVPALAAGLRTLPTWRDVQGVYARLVTPATDRLGAEATGSGYPRLADHAAAAGPRLDDDLAVPLLLAAARADARADWPLSVRAYAAALHRLAPRDRRTPAVLHEASGLSLHRGDHSGLLALGEPFLAHLDAQPAEHPEHPDGLESVTRAWVLAALHEHRSPYADDADPRWRTALERLPAAARLAALGGLYGIGPLPPGPGAAEHLPPGAGPGGGSGPLPSAAELRLVAAAVGGRGELRRARQGLPADGFDERALDRLRDSAAYGDLAGAFAAVLGDRYVTAGDSVATRYRAMVRDYLAGDWDAALAAARGIEVRSRSDGTAGAAQPARALAAEIHCMRGDVVRARAWLERIPSAVTHPLVTRAALGVRYWSGREKEAQERAWHDVRQARETGLLAGAERVLLRLLSLAALEDGPGAAHRALEELEELHEEAASPLTLEAVLIGRGIVHHDEDSALSAYRSLNRRGDVHLRVICCLCLTDVADDPRPWLSEAARDAHRLGMGRPVRTELIRAAQRRKVSVPRLRAASMKLTEPDVGLVRLVSDGATNRQIAVALACSEKTVEQRLTRLFQRTGCRSRAELAAAWLDGNLARLGLLP